MLVAQASLTSYPCSRWQKFGDKLTKWFSIEADLTQKIILHV